MASYHNEFESERDSACWYSNTDGPSSFDDSGSMDGYLTAANGHHGQHVGAQAPPQVYDLRNIDWNTVLIDTPGAYHHDVVPYHENAPSTQYPNGAIQGHVLDPLIPLQWPTAPATVWNTSQPSSEQLPASFESNSTQNLSTTSDPHRSQHYWSENLQKATIQHLGTDTSNDPSPFEHGLQPRRQDPRFGGDEYTAKWIRGDGHDRAGWCSRCSSWHKLKDSAYWYHMHYFHGISYTTGKPFDQPVDFRSTKGVIGYEALCRSCSQWILVGRAERWRTTYFRHAHNCQMKSKPQRAPSRSKSASPRKPTAKPSRGR